MMWRSIFAAAVMLGVLHGVAGHVCPPCKHDIQVKQNVGRMAMWCAAEYDNSLLAFNRTLQLLEVLAEKSKSIPDCELQASNLQGLITEAAAQSAAAAASSADIQADVKGFVSDDLYATYPEFTAALKSKIQALGDSAERGERSLGAGVGQILETCFQETPLVIAEPVEEATVTDDVVVDDETNDESSGKNYTLAWVLTLMAGGSTVLGAALVGVIKTDQHKLIASLNAFTAGIMVYGSLGGLANEAQVLLADSAFSQTTAFWTIFAMFSLGCLVCVALELLVHRLVHLKATQGQQLPVQLQKSPMPTSESQVGMLDQVSSNDTTSEEGSVDKIVAVAEEEDSHNLSRTSVLVMVAGVGLHNIAEGMATFIAALANPSLGIGLAIGMVMHNIPEGFAISVPWYTASGSRLQGFMLASVAGLAEILSALAIFVVVINVEDYTLKTTLFSCLFAIAGGMMTFIGVVELYPAAIKKLPNSQWPAAGFFIGMACMYLALGQLGIPKAY